MASIILSTAAAAAEGETELVIINVVTEDADWVGRFDRLQLFRSTQGEAGPFEELTAQSWEPPRLPKDAEDAPATPVTGGQVAVVGDTLSLDYLGQRIDVTFTGSVTLSLAQVATQIESQSLGRLRSYVTADGRLTVEGASPGAAVSLTILEGDAQTVLGLPGTPPDNLDYGQDPRAALVLGKTDYTFIDYAGSRDYFYRTRFLDRATGAQSDYTVSFSARDDVGVGRANTILGYAELAQMSGVVYEHAEVRVYNGYSSQLVNDRLVAGGGVVKRTDEDGRVEFLLVRGQQVTVAVQGTTLIRTITVPTDPALTSFNLFDPAIGEVDVFRVAVPELIGAERRSL